MENKGQKATPEVADGNHGGPGRVFEAKNGQQVGSLDQFFEIFNRKISIFLMFALKKVLILTYLFF